MFGPPTLHVTESPFVAVDGRIESYTSCCSATVEEAPRRTPLTLSDLNQSASRLFAEPFAAVFGKRWRIRTRLFSFFFFLFFFSFFWFLRQRAATVRHSKSTSLLARSKIKWHTHTLAHICRHTLTHSGTGQNKKRQLNLALTLDLTWPELTLPYFLLPNARYKMYFAACACVCVRTNVCVCVACQLKAIPNPQSPIRAPRRVCWQF